jgi:hypothetical protein
MDAAWSAAPRPFDGERIGDAGVRRLITRET